MVDGLYGCERYDCDGERWEWRYGLCGFALLVRFRLEDEEEVLIVELVVELDTVRMVGVCMFAGAGGILLFPFFVLVGGFLFSFLSRVFYVDCLSWFRFGFGIDE